MKCRYTVQNDHGVASSGERWRLREPRQRLLEVGLGELRVLEPAAQVVVVRAQVEVCRVRERPNRITRDSPASRAACASSIAALIACAASGAGMIPSVRANRHGGLERLVLPVGPRLDEPALTSPHDQRRVAVVAQPAGVHRRRHELVPERVHRHQRRQPDRVAEVVGVDPAGQRRARCRLGGEESGLRLPRSTRRTNGIVSPPKFEPPPTQRDRRRRAPRPPSPSAPAPPARSPSGAAARG